MAKSKTILAVVADEQGEVFEHPELLLAGMNGTIAVKPNSIEMIPMPEGSRLFTIPQTPPLGFDRRSGKLLTAERLPKSWGGGRIQAVSAFLTPGYTRTLLPAADYQRKGQTLPLWSYTAVGWCVEEERFYVAAVQVDCNTQWQPDHFDDRKLDPLVRKIIKENPDNCNSRCIGCISLQESDCCPASQERLTFVPTVQELCEVAVPHLQQAENAIVSFGQGCEGDPILQADVIAESVREMRRSTGQGTINFNSNASIPDAIDKLAAAGVESIRVSLNSAQESIYNAYYRPRGYRFADVLESLRRAKAAGLYVMLNYLVFPGVSDREDEITALAKLIDAVGVDMIQMRNLSLDPVLYLSSLGIAGKGVGMLEMLRQHKQRFPELQYGYFNRTKETFFPPGYASDWPIAE